MQTIVAAAQQWLGWANLAKFSQIWATSRWWEYERWQKCKQAQGEHKKSLSRCRRISQTGCNNRTQGGEECLLLLSKPSPWKLVLQNSWARCSPCSFATLLFRHGLCASPFCDFSFVTSLRHFTSLFSSSLDFSSPHTFLQVFNILQIYIISTFFLYIFYLIRFPHFSYNFTRFIIFLFSLLTLFQDFL